MARVFITGSTDGLGLLAAQMLVTQGHQVVLHARNTERAVQVRGKIPTAMKVLIADLSSVEETKGLAADVNALGRFDAIIHNAGVYQVSARLIFAVNTLAPYILTSLIQRPKRLIYIGSNLHVQDDPSLNNLSKDTGASYSDSKLQLLMLSMAAARKWPEVFVNTVDPGWVPTKMGGSSAPDDLEKGAASQVWLAVSSDAAAKVSGRYFFHQKVMHFMPKAADVGLQERLLAICGQISGVPFPTA